jgi:hypothetical protein
MATTSDRPSGAAIGFTLVAGVMMIMNGVYHREIKPEDRANLAMGIQ